MTTQTEALKLALEQGECKGAWELGSACGKCAKCVATKHKEPEHERLAHGEPSIHAGSHGSFSVDLPTTPPQPKEPEQESAETLRILNHIEGTLKNGLDASEGFRILRLMLAQPKKPEHDADAELNCAEEVLDGYAAHLDLEETHFDCVGDYVKAVVEAALKQVGKTEREPVAWLIEYEACAGGMNRGSSLTKFDYVWHECSFVSEYKDAEIDATKWRNRKETPLYTTPPQRTWVGLTDEERYDCLEASDCRDVLVKTIEAKLKEKNT